MPRPDYARGPLLGGLLSALLCASAPVLAASDDAKARAELERTETELRQSRAAAEAARQAQATARAELDKVRGQLVATTEQLQAEESDLAEIQERLEGLAAEEERQLESLDRQSHDLKDTLAALSRLARHSPTAMLAGNGPPLQAYRGVRLVAAVSEGLLVRTKKLKADLEALAGLRQEIQRAHERQQAHIADMTARRGQLTALVEQKARLERQLEDRSQTAREDVDRLTREVTDLHQLLDRLAEAEARRKAAAQAEAERRAETARLAELARRQEEARQQEQAASGVTGAEASTQQTAALGLPPLPGHKPGPEATTVVVNAVAQQRVPATSLFSEARGKLPMPARGRVVVGFGTLDDLDQKSRGVTIETVELAQVIAPFDGEVVFAGPFRGYGLLLIISLGEGYHILLSGMSRLYGVAGQQVLAGEPVGEMGTVEAQRPRLYVELRRRGEPINPRPWMSAAKGKISG